MVVLRASAEEQVLEEFTSRLELPGITSRRREPGERSICSHPAGMSAGRRVRLFCRRTNPMCGEILWRSVELRNVESHVEDGKAVVTGEILAAVLYSEEEESERLQWYGDDGSSGMCGRP